LSFEYKFLTAAHIDEFISYSARMRLGSGVGDTPIFSAFSRTKVIDKVGLAAHLDSAWKSPIGTPGWERTLGCFDGEKIVGDCELNTWHEESHIHRANLGMGVDACYRSKGIGKILLTKTIDWAKEQRSLKWIDLGVFADNAPARRLYENCGFIEVGRTVDAFRVDGHSLDDIQMTLDLDQLR